MTINTARVRNHVLDAGYSIEQFEEGWEYAQTKGFGSTEELLSLVMSKILYTTDEVERGVRFKVEPGSV